jgi:hypothetical protein
MLTLASASGESTDLNIHVVDVSGKEVMELPQMHIKASATYAIDISKLAVGTFFIELSRPNDEKDYKRISFSKAIN